jgi:epoxide hydrolase-like predicted phosphatase
MAAKYKLRCIRCKKNYVLASWKDRYVVCYECAQNEMKGTAKDPELKKLLNIPEDLYKENSFLRDIKIKALRYNNLSEKQIEAFKATVERMKGTGKLKKSAFPSKNIMAIIFDMGGVVYLGKMDDFFARLYESLKLDKKLVMAQYHNNREELLTGKMDDLAFCKIIVDKLKLDLTPRELFNKWSEAWIKYSVMNKKLIMLIRKLRDNYKIACISNATKLNVEIDIKLGIRKYFDPYVNSCEVGIMKPDRRIFEIVLKELGFAANECIFIDDRIEYLKIPEQMGFNVIHFVDNKQLANDLGRLGILF